jgi:hypothetical protein
VIPRLRRRENEYTAITRRLIPALLLFATVGLVVGSAAAGVAHGTSFGARITRDGISFRVSNGWRLTTRRINGVIDPVTVFTVSTFRVPSGPPSSGVCSRALQQGWRQGGAYVQLAEERDGASRKTMLRRVPPRPRHFRLDAKGSGGLCTPPDSGQFSFHENGRALYVFYGFGIKASPAARGAAVSLLDTMRIASHK